MKVTRTKTVFYILSVLLLAAAVLCTLFIGVRPSLTESDTLTATISTNREMDTRTLESQLEALFGEADYTIQYGTDIDELENHAFVTAPADAAEKADLEAVVAALNATVMPETAESAATDAETTETAAAVYTLQTYNETAGTGTAGLLWGSAWILLLLAVLVFCFVALRYASYGGALAGLLPVLNMVLAVCAALVTAEVLGLHAGAEFVAGCFCVAIFAAYDTTVLLSRLRAACVDNDKKRPYNELTDEAAAGLWRRSLLTTGAALVVLIAITVVSALRGNTETRCYTLPMMAGFVCAAGGTLFTMAPLWSDGRTASRKPVQSAKKPQGKPVQKAKSVKKKKK